MKNLSQQNITFLSDIDKKFEIDKSQKYNYFNIYDYSVNHITNFIEQIDENEILLIFPFITTTKDLNDPYLRLSNQFLVNNQSNPILISKYLEYRWNTSDFSVNTDSQAFLIFKYKKVYEKSIKF
jgi:hypothetical protein